MTQAANGETALDLLEQQRFVVVLTDIILGDIDGIEVLHVARLQHPPPEVIILTGHGSLDSSIAALRKGALDYLLKPCSTDELIECIKGAVHRYGEEQRMSAAAQCLREKTDDASKIDPPIVPEDHQAQSAPLQIGALCIGSSRHEVTFHSQPVRITVIEYMLLRYLAERAGQVCSYREIARHTHNIDQSDTNVHALLRSHLRSLRKKLDPSYLVNDRGRGYMLVDGSLHLSRSGTPAEN